MAQRVGANARQHARIKKMHAEGIPPHVISAAIGMTPQSLEHILAFIDERDEVILEIEDNADVQALRTENAELQARLAKYEEIDPGDDGPDNEDEID